MKNNIKYNVSDGLRLLMLLYTWVIVYLLTAIVFWFMERNGLTTPKLRIAVLLQDILMFIIPSIITAVTITKRPADFLLINGSVKFQNNILIALIIIFSIPIFNIIIEWNESLTLPESFSAIYSSMKNMEAKASENTEMLLGGGSIGSLIVGILIFGVAAGFSEELFFRGTLQQILLSSKINTHIAIWLTAIIFSFMHFQFFGFVPRLLLGALFGYLVVWSGSIWSGVVAHTINNIIATIIKWIKIRNNNAIDLDTMFQGKLSAIQICTLIIFSCAAVYLLYYFYKKTRQSRM